SNIQYEPLLTPSFIVAPQDGSGLTSTTAAASSAFAAKYGARRHRQIIPRAAKIRIAAGFPNLSVRNGEMGEEISAPTIAAVATTLLIGVRRRKNQSDSSGSADTLMSAGRFLMKKYINGMKTMNINAA